MGTVVSLDVRGAQLEDPLLRGADLALVAKVFTRLDARFSLYRPESELSLIAARQLNLTDASEELLAVYESAIDWRTATGGAFTPHRPDGVIDLDGIVKALAIDEAKVVLERMGQRDWCLNVGGDIVVAGSPEPPRAWTTGIVDPLNRTAILCTIELTGGRRALATSGTAERGEHVWRMTSESLDDFVQVSVVADDMVTADVLATAILAGGPDLLDIATERWPIDVLTVARGGELTATPGIRTALLHRV